MGGSGSHNGAVYTRGSPHDFNAWETMGNKNWSYASVLPYFRKSENMTNHALVGNGKFVFVTFELLLLLNDTSIKSKANLKF